MQSDNFSYLVQSNISANRFNLILVHAALLVVNIVGLFLLSLIGGSVGDIFAAAFYTALLGPLSFLCWFRPAYKAFR